MRALAYTRYTDAAALAVTDLPMPEPSEGRVRIKVAAASLNPFDWHMYRGEPWFMRLSQGMRVTDPRVVGADVAGVVEALGEGVTDLAVGDRVFGSIGLGALGEYAAPRASSLAHLPEGVSFEQGAAVAMAGLTALQAVRDNGALQAGQRVLVWGASGGVGHLAVQIARILGASDVDAVCSGRNAEWIRDAGARRVFDYTKQESPEGPYDLVVDTVSTASVAELRALLADGARVVTVGAADADGRVLGPAVPMVRRMISAKAQRVDVRGVMAAVTRDDLTLLGGWLADGSLTVRIQEVYGFDRVHDAIAELERGRVAGKLVVRLE
jgi:NADPH:quinone reductase-like Zn-dependent oxidoreductase